MAAPSKIRLARAAPDASIRIELMAETMLRHEAADGACTFAHLCAAGFSEAEIEAYRDPAREHISGRARAPRSAIPGRQEGAALVKQARALRRRAATAEMGTEGRP